MRIRLECSAFVLIAAIAAPASAQLYPGPFIGGGWGGWGSFGASYRDPASDYLRGIGYYQRAEGDYQVKAAEASKLRAEAFTQWNQAMSEARKAKEIRDAQNRDRRAVETAIRDRASLVGSGVILNQELDRIIDFPTDQTHAALAAIPLEADVLRDIPFENASEPVTACLAELTQADGWPPLLRESEFDEPRAAFSKAASAALKEDLDGSISEATRSELDGALDQLRTALKGEEGGLLVGADDADQFVRTLAGMVHLLEDAEGGKVFRMIETYQQGTLADLVGFMHAYNLRFGRSTSERQGAIYQQLDGMLSSIPTAQAGDPDAAVRPLVESSRLVGNAAKEIFSALSWDDIDKAAGK